MVATCQWPGHQEPRWKIECKYQKYDGNTDAFIHTHTHANTLCISFSMSLGIWNIHILSMSEFRWWCGNVTLCCILTETSTTWKLLGMSKRTSKNGSTWAVLKLSRRTALERAKTTRWNDSNTADNVGCNGTCLQFTGILRGRCMWISYAQFDYSSVDKFTIDKTYKRSPAAKTISHQFRTSPRRPKPVFVVFVGLAVLSAPRL